VPRRRKPPARALLPLLAYQGDPIRASLAVLGTKWTLLLLRDMAFLKLDRFGQLQRNNPGLTPRVLSRRLAQLQEEGCITRTEAGGLVTYALTAKGEDAIYILLALLRYGLRHHAPKGMRAIDLVPEDLGFSGGPPQDLPKG
jgi:DNA-binding HxlR family transcriptional regulator